MKKFEEEKIELEIKELKRNWFKRTDNLKLILTALFLVITAIVTYKTGILDSRGENLRLERNLLKIDIAEFKKEKSEIKNELKLLKDSLVNIRKVNELIQKKLIESYTKHEKLTVDKLRAENKIEEIIIYYKSKLDSLKMAIIKSKSIENTLRDQGGNYGRDQDGNVIMDQNSEYLPDENGEFVTDENGKRIVIK